MIQSCTSSACSVSMALVCFLYAAAAICSPKSSSPGRISGLSILPLMRSFTVSVGALDYHQGITFPSSQDYNDC